MGLTAAQQLQLDTLKLYLDKWYREVVARTIRFESYDSTLNPGSSTTEVGFTVKETTFKEVR